MNHFQPKQNLETTTITITATLSFSVCLLMALTASSRSHQSISVKRKLNTMKLIYEQTKLIEEEV